CRQQERHHRRRARGIRARGTRRRRARNGRRALHRVARGDPRRYPLGQRRAARGIEGAAVVKMLLSLVALLAFNAQGQEPPFPQRAPIEITVLFPAGTSADVTARMLADGMAKNLGQRVLVVNRPGAGGAIGYKYVRAQKPDGYSLVWNSNSISTTYHSGQLEFDYRAFDAVARVLVESVVVAVQADSRWRTLQDFVSDAKSKPKGLNVGHSGIGSHTHISLAALAS